VSEVLSWRFFSFRKVETLIFTTKAMKYPCFMTLALPRVTSFIAGTLLSLANRCEPSSYGSPFRVTNITLLSFRGKRLSRISIMFVLGSYTCSVLSRLGSLETLSFSLSSSLLFCIGFLRA